VNEDYIIVNRFTVRVETSVPVWSYFVFNIQHKHKTATSGEIGRKWKLLL